MIELSPDRLRRRVDPATLGFASTAAVAPVAGIIGQPRAVEALRLGLEMEDPTFHVYVAGPPGSGRTTAVQTFLREVAAARPTPPDWCYVNDFSHPARARALELPPGSGRGLAADLARLIERARAELPKAFDSNEYTTRRRELDHQLDADRKVILDRVKNEASEAGFYVQTGPAGLLIIPASHGRPLTNDLKRVLTAADLSDLEHRQHALEERVGLALKEVRALEEAARREVAELDRLVTLGVVGGLVDDLIEKHQGAPAVLAHLTELREALVADRALARKDGEEPSVQLPEWLTDHPFRRYEVNVLVDRTGRAGAPVVLEQNPTYLNLFGRLDREAHLGTLHTDFTLIRPGALHRANGGYLVVPARELLVNYLSYESLKRALRERKLAVEDPAEALGLTTTRSLETEPIPLAVKVVVIGSPLLYHLLCRLDDDFPELFKVKADFDERMDRAEAGALDYAAFVRALCDKESLPPLDGTAVALLMEHGSRLAEDQAKLTTRFAALADVIREAAHYARQEGAVAVTAAQVRRALHARVYRSNLVEEQVREMVERGTIRVETAGEAVGQVNGISVIDLGDHAFGRPTRITATVGPGRAGVVDIEREARLGGRVHSKAVMILAGWITSRFAAELPLSLTGRLVFEQSYSGVEGDSSSCAEAVALISALSRLPARQAIAVTGSLDQHGRVQAVGGVNEKIEGFFDVCRVRGLDGSQGVVIPAGNVENLMLREDVVEAAAAGRFHVWTADRVEEVVELLMGAAVGETGDAGLYPEGSVYRAVADRLETMAATLAEYGELGEEPA